MKAEIAIIGGTGVYDPGLLKKSREVKVFTPYGEPSDTITIGDYAGRKIAFVSRHGKGHRIPPHKINYRANIWALKELGVTRILAPSAVGSLKLEFQPGDLVFPDQFIDFTKLRDYTFYDGGKVCHISVAEPFCDELRKVAIKQSKKLKFKHHPAGTYICIEGPRFSTKAESNFFRSIKAEIIGMTMVPECVLAREMEICYLPISSVTDYDVWREHPVTTEAIIATLTKNVVKTKELLAEIIPQIPKKARCQCQEALTGAMI